MSFAHYFGQNSLQKPNEKSFHGKTEEGGTVGPIPFIFTVWI